MKPTEPNWIATTPVSAHGTTRASLIRALSSSGVRALMVNMHGSATEDDGTALPHLADAFSAA